MDKNLILIHEEAMRISHPVFRIAPKNSKSIFIWDDKRFNNVNYSFKRIVFIYETISKLPLDIIKGDTKEVIAGINPPRIYIPKSNNPIICETIDELASSFEVKIVDDDEFVSINTVSNLNRFSQYWKQAEKNIFKESEVNHS